MPLLTSASFKTIFNGTLEHETTVPAIPTGSDLTVTVYVNGLPAQPFSPKGVIVYVIVTSAPVTLL